MPEVYENYSVLQNVIDHQEYFNYRHDLQQMNGSTGMLSPYSSSMDSQGNKSISSPMSISSSPLHLTNYITLNDATVLEDRYLTIVEQPIEKFRFRYKSEMMGTHGSLVGVSSTTSSRRKHAPTVKLHNYPGKAIIRCTLVTSDEDQRIPHAHRLVRRQGNEDCDDPHHIEVSPENGFMASFHGMGIIHTAKKNVRDQLIEKLRAEALEKLKRKNVNATLSYREEAQIKADAEIYQKCMNLNSVALCFQAFILDQNDVLTPITDPVYSHAINNLKSALTGELKICRIDKYTSSCEGGEEVFILVEKVGRKNIKIKFFELNEDDNEIWVDYGHFSELDVHHQYAIVFRTPPYRDLNITSPKEVFIQLERPSDSDCSEPIKFTYKPSDKILGRKRQRISYSGSSDLTQMIRHNVDVPYTSNNESEVSKEINKILSDGCSSAEFREFIAAVDVNSYEHLVRNSEENNMLVCDGPSTKKLDEDSSFAKHTISEAIKTLKSKEKDKKDRIRKLLKDRSIYGDSPLHSALRHGQREIAKYILMLIGDDSECKTLVNIQNSSGKTPLHYAVLLNQPEIAKALLILGADPNACDDHGFSPLHMAVRIPEAGACVDALLSEKLTNIEAYNDAGWTPFQLAAEAGSNHAIRSLVKAGVNVNSTDMSYGRTALHIAVEGGHKEIVEYLVKETDIDVNKRNFSGNTALHSAVVNTGSRAKDLCKLLIQHGADPHIPNNNRVTFNAEKKKETNNMHVKQELDSEDENIEAAGESSFDLAMNKPDILELLSGKTTEEEDAISPKEEVIDYDFERKWLGPEEKKELARILNETEGWKKLAKHVAPGAPIRTFQQNSNPSSQLLTYIDAQCSMSLTTLHELLNEIGEIEASTFVAEILTTSS